MERIQMKRNRLDRYQWRSTGPLSFLNNIPNVVGHHSVSTWAQALEGKAGHPATVTLKKAPPHHPDELVPTAVAAKRQQRLNWWVTRNNPLTFPETPQGREDMDITYSMGYSWEGIQTHQGGELVGLRRVGELLSHRNNVAHGFPSHESKTFTTYGRVKESWWTSTP